MYQLNCSASYNRWQESIFFHSHFHMPAIKHWKFGKCIFQYSLQLTWQTNRLRWNSGLMEKNGLLKSYINAKYKYTLKIFKWTNVWYSTEWKFQVSKYSTSTNLSPKTYTKSIKIWWKIVFFNITTPFYNNESQYDRWCGCCKEGHIRHPCFDCRLWTWFKWHILICSDIDELWFNAWFRLKGSRIFS